MRLTATLSGRFFAASTTCSIVLYGDVRLAKTMLSSMSTIEK